MEKLKKADPHYFWILFIEEVSWPFSWLRVQFIEIWSKISFQDLLLEGKIGYSVSSLPQAFGAIWDWSMTKYLNYGLVPRGQGGPRSKIHSISWTPYCVLDTSDADDGPRVGKIRIVILLYSFKTGKSWRISRIGKIDFNINQAHQHRLWGSDNNILSWPEKLI